MGYYAHEKSVGFTLASFDSLRFWTTFTTSNLRTENSR